MGHGSGTSGHGGFQPIGFEGHQAGTHEGYGPESIGSSHGGLSSGGGGYESEGSHEGYGSFEGHAFSGQKNQGGYESEEKW